jgi:uncharacterized protein (DUF1330 family)
LAYALAPLRRVDPHPDVLECMERIHETLDPFGGRFLVHGAISVCEGSSPGTLVLIEFPTIEDARAWYNSAAYRAILPLRTRHAESDTLLVEGVGPGHDSGAMAAQMRASGWPQGKPDATA